MLRDRYGKSRCTHMYNRPLTHLGRSATGIPASCASGSGALADQQEMDTRDQAETVSSAVAHSLVPHD